MKPHRFQTIYILLFSLLLADEPVFKIVPLGVKGGEDESNLSSYMVAPIHSDNFICLDAGTLHAGIVKAIDKGVFKKTAKYVLENNIKAYLISHAHLDHIAGLIINSPSDSPKNIYALPHVLDIIVDKYFSWDNWANFTDRGEEPKLNKYHLQSLYLDTEVAIQNTDMSVKVFELSHVNPYKSSAFLIRHNESSVLYLGDTGSDIIEKSTSLNYLWEKIAPLIISKQLKAIFMEVSFPNSQPNNYLYGHLTPRLFFNESEVLESYLGENGLSDFPIIVIHRKPNGNNEEIIKSELLKNNVFNINLIFPEQGRLLTF